MKDRILEAMNDMLQRNIICNYLIKMDDEIIILNDVHALDAYMYAYELSCGSKNVYCYMLPLGEISAAPVFEVENRIVKLCGQELININIDLFCAIYNVIAKSRIHTNYEYLFNL